MISVEELREIVESHRTHLEVGVEIHRNLEAKFVIEAPKKTRVVSKMSKNIQLGDRVDFPGFGEREVNGWSRCDGIVTVTAGTHLTTFDENERVRIVREVAA